MMLSLLALQFACFAVGKESRGIKRSELVRQSQRACKMYIPVLRSIDDEWLWSSSPEARQAF